MAKPGSPPCAPLLCASSAIVVLGIIGLPLGVVALLSLAVDAPRSQCAMFPDVVAAPQLDCAPDAPPPPFEVAARDAPVRWRPIAP